MSFNDQLVLNHYFLSLFGVESFDNFSELMSDSKLEEPRADGYSQYIYLLDENFSEALTKNSIDFDKLKYYDENISAHTAKLKRIPSINWKYFQYLTLLFTEIYLDRYFDDRESFCDELNDFLDKFNRKNGLKTPQFESSELNSLSYWNATGSGKTLIMHVNYHQYSFYSKKEHSAYLITPSESLSKQHLEELHDSSFCDAGIFSLHSALRGSFNIIENTKISDETKESQVAVDSLGTKNLVFIDEGHKGQSGNTWKKNRDKISMDGFRFEYSATFGQSLSQENEAEYSKSILFDYSYKYFYNDGYGKDYSIYNIKDEEANFTYKVGSLLSFYEQMKIYEENKTTMQDYQIKKPLMAFVGHSVNSTSSAKKVKEENEEVISDVAEAIVFIDNFFKNDTQKEIANILNTKSGILNIYNKDIFQNKFEYLKKLDLSCRDIYRDIKKILFNADSEKPLLELNELKQTGEISLSVSGQEFGVVNVGETVKLMKTLSDKGIKIKQKAISSSPFEQINTPDSKINILIGAKKFSEGWSSWRVSTMMLLRVGRSEGSQIIQLFGRGVRLRGHSFSLKRSTAFGMPMPREMRSVETLSIFGIKADYMTKFQEYLEKEGIATSDKFEICLPVKKNEKKEIDKLTILTKNINDNIYNTLKEYRKILDIDPKIKKKIVVDLYTQSQVTESQQRQQSLIIDKDILTLSEIPLALLDWDNIYFEITEYKKRKKYYNTIIKKEALKNIIDQVNVEIYISGFKFEDRGDLKLIHKIVMEILRKYFDIFYKFYKDQWETKQLKYISMNNDEMQLPTCKIDANDAIGGYKFSISVSKFDNGADLMEFIKELAQSNDAKEVLKQIKELAYSNSDLKDLLAKTINNYDDSKCEDNKEIEGVDIFCSESHLYNPLVYKSDKQIMIDIVPLALNDGERKFVKDLKSFLEKERGYEVYLLRNQSKTGVGFYGFYPDFIMWVLKDDKQYINFIDPKGILHLGFDSEKIELASKIKDLEKILNNKNIILNSFIVSNTNWHDLNKENKKKEEWEDNHVVFQEDKEYLKKIFKKILG